MASSTKATHTRCGVDSISPVRVVRVEENSSGVCVSPPSPLFLQVYTQVEATGEDFLTYFRANFAINIISDSDEEIVFDMVGVDAPIANALRRILLSEVPSVALETVWISKNTSIIQDEIFAHRLGLIPLRIDPRKLADARSE